MRFSGSRILVVGGSSGIGRAVAKEAIDAGGYVIIASRSPARLDAARQHLGNRVATMVLDMADEAGMEKALQSAGLLDHVVVTAAEVHLGPFREMPTAQAMADFETKFWGSWRLARLCRPQNSLTLTSGVWSRRPAPGAAHVAAINAALEGLARALAVELAPLRVNCVCPGVVDTETYAGMDRTARRQFLAQAAGRTALGRVGQPQDLAHAYLFCMESQHLTGQTLVVDGGGVLV